MFRTRPYLTPTTYSIVYLGVDTAVARLCCS